MDVGWTISGQLCLHRVGGPVYISAHRTTVTCPEDYLVDLNSNHASIPNEMTNYRVTLCPNHFLITERYGERIEEPGNDIFLTRSDENEISMSREDRHFLDIMKEGIHKNQQGNWEMLLPFCSEDVLMPNNRSQTLSRLNGLVRSFKRRPLMEKDYCEFLREIIERGHATPIRKIPP